MQCSTAESRQLPIYPHPADGLDPIIALSIVRERKNNGPHLFRRRAARRDGAAQSAAHDYLLSPPPTPAIVVRRYCVSIHTEQPHYNGSLLQ